MSLIIIIIFIQEATCRYFMLNRLTAVVQASVMESEFNECSLFKNHENKEATIRTDRQFSGTKGSLLVDVISPFCCAHNTSVAAERRLQTSPSQACLCIRSSQSMAALMHLSSPIERPAALFFLVGHFTIRTSNTK